MMCGESLARVLQWRRLCPSRPPSGISHYPRNSIHLDQKRDCNSLHTASKLVRMAIGYGPVPGRSVIAPLLPTAKHCDADRAMASFTSCHQMRFITLRIIYAYRPSK